MAKEEIKQENLDQLFNPGTEIETPGSKNIQEYRPSAKKGKGGVYQSVIRFVPWWKDPTHGSIRDKWVSYLIDPVTERGRFVDCPSSVGKQSPLLDMYRKLSKSESVQEQKQADVFKRRHTYAALIQVLKDENEPELEGKILVWRFGIKIYEKITSELKPVMGEKHDPFDLLDGKAFALKIVQVKGYNNYDQAKFLDKKIPLCIPDDSGKLKPIKKDMSAGQKKEVFEWLKNNSPNIEKYDYTEWDQETVDYVNHVINAVTGKTNVASQYSDIVSNAQKYDGTTNKSGESFSNQLNKSQDSQDVTTEDISIEDSNTPESSESDNLDVGGIDDLPSIDDENEDLNKNDNTDDGIGGDDLDTIMQNA